MKTEIHNALKILDSPIHPGEYLKEILEKLGISQADFSRSTGLSTMRVSHVINGKRSVTAEMSIGTRLTKVQSFAHA